MTGAEDKDNEATGKRSPPASELCALTPEAVAELQRAFVENQKRCAERLLPSDAPPGVKTLAADFLLAAHRANQQMKDEVIRQHLAQSPKDIASDTKSLIAQAWPVSLYNSLRFRFAKSARKPQPDLDRVFGTADRLYFPLSGIVADSAVMWEVGTWLQKRNYRIFDYKQGYAVDQGGKQKFRIAKLIRSDERLYKAFVADGARSGDNLIMVVSRRPEDILFMSTNRGWDSCMTSGGSNFGVVFKDIREGTLAAYLISPGDPEINDPRARILLKPFIGTAGDTIWLADKGYGLTNSVFEKAARLFADGLNQGKYGEFTVAPGLWRDHLMSTVNRLVNKPPLTPIRFTVG